MLKKARNMIILGAILLSAALLYAGAEKSYAQERPEGNVVRGGQLYQAWDEVLRVSLPDSDQPIWKEIAPNEEYDPRSWRCVTCHGWDYRGSDGWAPRAIVNRSGIPGLFEMVAEPQKNIVAWLNGTENPGHDFSEYLSTRDMRDISAFLAYGLVAPELIADPETQLVQGTVSTGEEVYGDYCQSCHGVDGAKINFGSAANPQYLSDITLANPYRVAHVVRFGHLTVNMPSAETIKLGFSQQIDLLAYAQTLPQARIIGSPDYPVIEYENQAHTEMLAYTALGLMAIITGGTIWVTKRKPSNPKP